MIKIKIKKFIIIIVKKEAPINFLALSFDYAALYIVLLVIMLLLINLLLYRKRIFDHDTLLFFADRKLGKENYLCM